jgi:hypothetical protein
VLTWRARSNVTLSWTSPSFGKTCDQAAANSIVVAVYSGASLLSSATLQATATSQVRVLARAAARAGLTRAGRTWAGCCRGPTPGR